MSAMSCGTYKHTKTEWRTLMRPKFENTLEIVKLRQKVCFYQGKLFGIHELLDMASEWLSEHEIEHITIEVESLSGHYNMLIEDTKDEIEKLRKENSHE
jgi:predicted transcriptional regulator